MREREESDQLPEEAPSEQVAEDDPQGDSAREEAGQSPGVPGGEDPQTGNPANAGEDDDG